MENSEQCAFAPFHVVVVVAGERVSEILVLAVFHGPVQGGVKALVLGLEGGATGSLACIECGYSG